MHAVANDLGIGALARHGAGEKAGGAVVVAAHAVVGVDEHGGAAGDGGHALLVGGIGVAQGARDAQALGLGAVLGAAVALGGERALADQAVRGLLPAAQKLDARVAHVGGVLRAGVPLGEERPLQEDALDASARKVARTALGGLGDAGAGGLDLVDGLGQGRGRPRGGAATGKLERCGVDAGDVAIHDVMADVAVDVGVNVAGRDPTARAVDDLEALGRLGREDPEGPLDDWQVAGAKQAAGQDEAIGLDGKAGCGGGLVRHGGIPF